MDGRGNMTKKVETEKTTGGSENIYTTFYEYNSQNKLEKITDPLNNVTTFTYDGLGKLITSKDAEGNTVNHEYDGFGRKTKTTRVTSGGLNIETNFEYYPDNKLKSITDAKGNKSWSASDYLGRTVKTVDPDKGTWSYYYDSYGGYTSTGNLIAQTDAKSQTITFEYDFLAKRKKQAFESLSETLDEEKANEILDILKNQFEEE